MILLDTNVVSDPLRPRPDSTAREWLNAQKPGELFICTPVLAEMRYGIERLPAGDRRRRLEELASKIENEGFADRILSFDRSAAHEFGRLYHLRTRIGRPIGVMDAVIAAIAAANGALIATRDVDDFADLGLEVVNPFEPSASTR